MHKDGSKHTLWTAMRRYRFNLPLFNLKSGSLHNFYSFIQQQFTDVLIGANSDCLY